MGQLLTAYRQSYTMQLLMVLAVSLLPLCSSQMSTWWDFPFKWLYSSTTLGGIETPVEVEMVELDTKLVQGRYLLKRHMYDGLERVLTAYGVEADSIKAIRDATIVTAIELSEDGMIAISTSDADSDDEANTVPFTPGTATNISNPLNGEAVEFMGTVLAPTMIQTKSTGMETNTVEIKTWQFSPFGASVNTEIVKEEEMLIIMASQVMLRVDEE